MDPIRSLKTLLASGPSGTTEGKVESRDDRKGTVVVRVSGNETVVAQGSGLEPGDRVLVAKGPEGGWVARPLVRPEVQHAPVLSTWMTEQPGSELGEALRSGEPRLIRTALVALWRRLDSSNTAQELPQALEEARRRGMPPLVSRGDASVRTVPTPGAVPLALRAETTPGVYRGETPGRRFELLGPPGIRLGEAGLWTESVLSEILSVWLPTAVEDGAVPGLPSRVAADASGARRLLDHLGVELSPEEAESPSFRALVRSLARAGAIFLGETPAETASPQPGSSLPGAPTSVSAAIASLPQEATKTMSPSALRPSNLPPDGRISAPLPNQAEKSLSGRNPPDQRVGSPASGGPTLPTGFPSMDPSMVFAETSTISREDATHARTSTGTGPTDLARSSVVSNPAMPSSATMDSGRVATAPVRELPAAVALRVVLSWLVAAEEPSESLLRAAVGGFRELPEALQILARAQDLRPEDFEAVSAFLSSAAPEEPLLPRDLGLDRRAPAGPAAHDPNVPRPLSQAIVEDLARALTQGRTEDASVLREALGSLVGEALDRARDPANPAASAPWTMPPTGDRPDSGRVVVRDRRKSSDTPSDRTVVEVSMNPSGLGSVDARLELRGDDLDVVFHAREAATVERIREHLPELRGILTQLGLQPRDLESRSGKPGVAKRPSDVRESSGGLDIRA